MADAFDVIPFEVGTLHLLLLAVCMPRSGYQGGLEETRIRLVWQRLQGSISVSSYRLNAHIHIRVLPWHRRRHQGGTSLE